MAVGFWTPERVKVLTLYWLAGATPDQLVKLLGANSRNAVIGKIHRLGLSGKGGRLILKNKKEAPYVPSAPRTPANYKIKAAKPKKSIAPNEAARAKQEQFTTAAENGTWLTRVQYAEPIEPVALNDLREKHCRWPCANGGKVTTHFCGKDKVRGSPYCEEHRARAIDPASYRRLIARRQAAEQFRGNSRLVAGNPGADAAA